MGYESNKKYLQSCFRMCLTINPKTEPEIVKRLESVGNKSGYIKELIRKDIEDGRPA